MATKKHPKPKLRKELADAGIVYTNDKAVERFMYKGSIVDLRTCTVRKALLVANDSDNKILGYKKPAKSASGSGDE